MTPTAMTGLVDAVFGIEPTGFILGSTIAHDYGVGFVPIRKPGKLPAAVTRLVDLEIHTADLVPGQTVLLVGDERTPEIAAALKTHGLWVVYGRPIR